MKGKKLWLAGFVGLVFAVSLFLGFGVLFLPTEENRANQVLAAQPKLTGSDGALNLDFFSEFETWLGDHFALRQTLITANAALLAGVFHSSNTDQVIVGREGWLFYASSADDYLNIPTMTEREAANAAISLSLMQEYAQTQGAQLLFMAVPNKNSVYPEYMPAQYLPLRQSGSLEQLTAALEREQVNQLDLLSVLLGAREGLGGEDFLYHRLDSHWNNLGAAYAADAVLAALGLAEPGYAELDYRVCQDFPGDLYEMLYPKGTELSYNQYYDVFTYSTGGQDRAATDAIRYAASNPEQTHSLLMFRDSFGNALAPFLAQSFGESLFSRAVPYDLDLIAAQGADFVVLELAERNLNTLATRAAVMAAPVRELPLPETRVEALLTAESARSGDYWRLTGSFEAEAADIGSRIYAALTIGDETTVYEAAPVGAGGEGSYTLYIPATEAETATLSLLFTQDGVRVASEQISVTMEP